MLTRLLLLIGLFALPSPQLAAVEPPPFTACVWIRAENDGSGAGFVFDAEKKRLLTCRHVVADRDRVDVYFPWQLDGKLVTEKSEYLGNRLRLREQGLLVTGKVIKRSDDVDLALVELESLPRGVTALPLADKPAQPGDPLRVIGYRIDLDTLFNVTTGPVRQTGRLADGYFWRGKKLAAGADVIIGQLPIEEGDSGGPVLNSRGELVGMASALRRQTPSAAIAISAAEIRKFLAVDEPKVKPDAAGIGDKLIRATVWIRPTATDVNLAGVLFEKNLILTSAKGLGSAERVGIAFPLFEDGKFVGERAPYRDPIGMSLKRHWHSGTVIAKDDERDLALIRVLAIPESSRPLAFAEQSPEPGDAIHTMSHPGGLELAWVYAFGTVRQQGRIALADGEKSPKLHVNVLQVPAQAASPGGPVVNNRGELIGVLSVRESPQQTGYAASLEEVHQFLDIALIGPAKTLAGVQARVRAFRAFVARTAALILAFSTAQSIREQRFEYAECINRLALELDPQCHQAFQSLFDVLNRTGRSEESARMLGAYVEGESGGPSYLKAELYVQREEWRKARGMLEQHLEIYPLASMSRRRLIGVLLELKKDDEAATAAGDVLRSDPKSLPFLAADLLRQSQLLEKKFPNTPSVPASWLNRAIGAAQKSTPDTKQKAEFEVVLKAAAEAPDDAARLAILRAFLDKTSKKE